MGSAKNRPVFLQGRGGLYDRMQPLEISGPYPDQNSGLGVLQYFLRKRQNSNTRGVENAAFNGGPGVLLPTPCWPHLSWSPQTFVLTF